jgi:hypothetical protein
MTRRKRAIDEHYVRKASDETISSSTTLQADNELLFPVGINETWAFTICILFNSGTTPDFRLDFESLPSGAAGNYTIVYAPTVQTSAALNNSLVVPGTGSDAMILLHGQVRTSAAAGNISLFWAQNTSNAGDTKVLADSILMAWRVD